MLWHLISVVGSMYLAILVVLFLLQGRMLYLPDSALIATPKAVDLAFEDVRITTDDGVVLHGWLVPGPAAAPVVLFFHGNAGNISHRLESLRVFHRLGLTTLIIDYRGYGHSAGSPTEEGTYRDAEAAWRYLTQERGIDGRRIIVFGRSLGGGVAVWLATRTDPAALIIESTFTSVPDLAAKIYPWLPVRWLARFRYDSREKIALVKAPVLVVHSRNDEIVPFSHAKQLFEAAPTSRRLMVLRGGHNDGFIVSMDDYLQGLNFFLGGLGIGAGQTRPEHESPTDSVDP